jgi:hypothetical protein
MLFSERPVWIARNPALRRTAVKAWRGLLRMQRATFANAILVVRNSDGRVLLIRAPTGELRLPTIPLDAWLPIPTQVEEWLEEVLQQRSTPSLVAIDGTPGREGVTFLYAATLETPSERGDELWLEPDVAAGALGGNDNRFLLLCADQAL